MSTSVSELVDNKWLMSGELQRNSVNVVNKDGYTTIMEMFTPVRVENLEAWRYKGGNNFRIRLTINGVTSEHKVNNGVLIGRYLGQNFPGLLYEPEMCEKGIKIEVYTSVEDHYRIEYSYNFMERA